MSFWTKPIVAAKNAVQAPLTVITASAVSEYSIKGEHLIIRNTPAVL